MSTPIRGRELLEDHALARGRLVGSLLQDVRWRERRDRGTTRRLLGGTVLAVVVCLALAAGAFVSTQLASQRRDQQQRNSPAPTATAPTAPSLGGSAPTGSGGARPPGPVSTPAG